tara:strand:+ start:416 stop:910 length:495 start_codon:yes stop_codon:yes gene_type:complete
MERRLNRKIEDYVSGFKDEIRNKISSLDIDDKDKSHLLLYLYEYPRLVLEHTDVVKRKRVKNVLPVCNRCNAKRANGEQCTRKRKDNLEFCGTHSKGTPHGIIDDEVKTKNTVDIVLRMEQINGIVYHIDNYNNVYQTEDIINNELKPKIIGKYDVKKNIVVIS